MKLSANKNCKNDKNDNEDEKELLKPRRIRAWF